MSQFKINVRVDRRDDAKFFKQEEGRSFASDLPS